MVKLFQIVLDDGVVVLLVLYELGTGRINGAATKCKERKEERGKERGRNGVRGNDGKDGKDQGRTMGKSCARRRREKTRSKEN